MPNYCSYTMAVRGRKCNVDEFISILQYNHPKYAMFRVFEAEVYDTNVYGMVKKVYIYGYCAWSVDCCMMPGFASYYSGWYEAYQNALNGKLDRSYPNILTSKLGTNLINESSRLHLEIEVYSTEPGIGFCEYYRISNGIVLADKEGEYQEYCIAPEYYKSWQDFKQEYEGVKLPFDEAEFLRLRAERKDTWSKAELNFPDSIRVDDIPLDKILCQPVGHELCRLITTTKSLEG